MTCADLGMRVQDQSNLLQGPGRIAPGIPYNRIFMQFLPMSGIAERELPHRIPPDRS